MPHSWWVLLTVCAAAGATPAPTAAVHGPDATAPTSPTACLSRRRVITGGAAAAALVSAGAGGSPLPGLRVVVTAVAGAVAPLASAWVLAPLASIVDGGARPARMMVVSNLILLACVWAGRLLADFVGRRGGARLLWTPPPLLTWLLLSPGLALGAAKLAKEVRNGGDVAFAAAAVVACAAGFRTLWKGASAGEKQTGYVPYVWDGLPKAVVWCLPRGGYGPRRSASDDGCPSAPPVWREVLRAYDGRRTWYALADVFSVALLSAAAAYGPYHALRCASAAAAFACVLCTAPYTQKAAAYLDAAGLACQAAADYTLMRRCAPAADDLLCAAAAFAVLRAVLDAASWAYVVQRPPAAPAVAPGTLGPLQDACDLATGTTRDGPASSGPPLTSALQQAGSPTRPLSRVSFKLPQGTDEGGGVIRRRDDIVLSDCIALLPSQEADAVASEESSLIGAGPAPRGGDIGNVASPSLSSAPATPPSNAMCTPLASMALLSPAGSLYGMGGLHLRHWAPPPLPRGGLSLRGEESDKDDSLCAIRDPLARDARAPLLAPRASGLRISSPSDASLQSPPPQRANTVGWSPCRARRSEAAPPARPPYPRLSSIQGRPPSCGAGSLAARARSTLTSPSLPDAASSPHSLRLAGAALPPIAPWRRLDCVSPTCSSNVLCNSCRCA